MRYLLFAVAGSHPVATNKDELKSLMAAHVAVVPARGCVCLLCNTVCSNQTTIRRHFLLAHYDDGTAYRCPVCENSVFQGGQFNCSFEYLNILFEFWDTL